MLPYFSTLAIMVYPQHQHLTMKPILFLLASLFIAHATLGQGFDKDKMFYAAKAERYKRMKNTGMILSIAGGIMAVVGVSKMSKATSNATYYNGTYYYNNGSNADAETGALLFLGGTAGLGAGIPLWIVGAHAQRKYERKLEGIGVRLNINQQNKGLTLSYRF
ncbi:MAG: hypothetical protein DI538_07545 [Azospira oryzae]|nr:hypothetical protein [Cytophaga sp.]PZR39161.1 MAG: hypothetical protein DI538_07545 [Azospira oryzae]